MNDEIKRRVEAAADAYATGNHRASFPDTFDKRAFTAGAHYERKHARAGMLRQVIAYINDRVGIPSIADELRFEYIADLLASEEDA